jgi:exodeoxyribonuclease V gamma subunit
MWFAMFGGVTAGAPRKAANVVTLGEAVMALNGASRLPITVHVFGFAHYAPAFHDFFRRLAEHTEVVIYAVSPCEGFWEDRDPSDPVPLRLWGRPGREQVQALNAAAGFDHDDVFVDPVDGVSARRSTLLEQLQSDLLRRTVSHSDDDTRARFGGDESVLVLEHASLRRELEVVASEIWRLLESSEDLCFDDVAVLLPEHEAGAYAAHLPLVFAEAHALPYQTTGVAFGATGGVLEAIELLLALPLGDLSRRDVLAILCHPAIGKPPGVDTQRWESWSKQMGVFRGADRRDYAGTHVQGDLLNWDQGLRRLALGTFMAGDASDVRTAYELDGEQYVPVEVAPSDFPDAAAFGFLVRSLLADACFARDEKLTLSEWARYLRSIVETYVVPISADDERELTACLRKLYTLGEQAVGAEKVRYRLACELARRKLASEHRGRSGSGVVVSTLRATRGVPFRVVFACGMSEGQFPAASSDDPLDLRLERRRPGDLTARDLDRYAFLELLVSTRDRIVLSYVSRDPLTGQPCPPSSVVQELFAALSSGYVDDVNRLRRRHPLRRWDAGYFPDLFSKAEPRAGWLGSMALPEAEAEARTSALRRDLDAKDVRLEPQDIIARAANDPAFRSLAGHLGLLHVRVPVAPPHGIDRHLLVPAHVIAKFLEFPLQAWARFRLGLSDRDDGDLELCEDEPLETDFREETLFLRRVLLDANASGRSLAEVYGESARERELRGEGPSGAFGRAERMRHLAALDSWSAQLAERGIAGTMEVHRFGPASEHAQADKVHEPLAIDVDYVDRDGVVRLGRVDIGGRTLPFALDARQSPTWVTLTKRSEEGAEPWTRAGRDRVLLRAFVNEAMMVAAGVVPEGAHSSLSLAAAGATEQVDFAPLSRRQATDWLRAIVRELVSAPHAYCLPCEAVFARHHEDPEGPIAPYVQAAIQKLKQSEGAPTLRSAYGPIPRPHLYPAPEEARAVEMVERRFGLLFSKRKDQP